MQDQTNNNENNRDKPRKALRASKLGAILGYKSRDIFNPETKTKLTQSMLKNLIHKLYPKRYSEEILNFDFIKNSKHLKLPKYFREERDISSKVNTKRKTSNLDNHDIYHNEKQDYTAFNVKMSKFSTLQVDSAINHNLIKNDTESDISEPKKSILMDMLDSDKFKIMKNKMLNNSISQIDCKKENVNQILNKSNPQGISTLPKIDNIRKMKLKYNILRQSNKSQNHYDNLNIMKKYYNSPNQLPDNSKNKFICRRGSLSINKSIDILESLSRMDRNRLVLLKPFNLYKHK